MKLPNIFFHLLRYPEYINSMGHFTLPNQLYLLHYSSNDGLFSQAHCNNDYHRKQWDQVLISTVELCFHRGDYPRLYGILRKHKFAPLYHAYLQNLWYQAHYTEAEATRKRALGPVEKHRIRRKFPPPRTIWDGEATLYCFKERTRKALLHLFSVTRYPNIEQKLEIISTTGLSMTQVSACLLQLQGLVIIFYNDS